MRAKGKHLENVMLMPVKDLKRPKVRTKPKKGFTWVSQCVCESMWEYVCEWVSTNGQIMMKLSWQTPIVCGRLMMNIRNTLCLSSFYSSFQFASFLCIQQAAERYRSELCWIRKKEREREHGWVCFVAKVANVKRLATLHVDKRLATIAAIACGCLFGIFGGWLDYLASKSKSLINCSPSDKTYHLQLPRAL